MAVIPSSSGGSIAPLAMSVTRATRVVDQPAKSMTAFSSFAFEARPALPLTSPT